MNESNLRLGAGERNTSSARPNETLDRGPPLREPIAHFIMRFWEVNAVLSQTAEYALRATLHLARHDDGAPIRVDDVARDLDVPRNYLSKILHELGKEGILDSTRGPKGGFRLARPAKKITLKEVVERFDPEALADEGRCVLGRLKCDDRDPCAAHERWKGVASRIRAFFRETTLAELTSPAPREELEASSGATAGQRGSGEETAREAPGS